MTPDGFAGIWVSPDDVVYALAQGSTGTGGSPIVPGTIEVDVTSHAATLQFQAVTSLGTATGDMVTNADNTIYPFLQLLAETRAKARGQVIQAAKPASRA
jgi:hypothetical protein